MVNENAHIEKIKSILDQINDPEIPVISITDLGIVRDIQMQNDQVIISITPTYSGCPAMDMITTQIRMEMLAAGYKQVEIRQILSPAWTTDWMTEQGKTKLVEYGIAAPLPTKSVCTPTRFAAEEAIQCPHCKSYNTKRISEFGSTACKALYHCESCLEPFDYFKCH